MSKEREMIRPDIYREKLNDKRWHDKRQRILERDKNKCIICNSSHNLIVHHKQYHFIKSLQVFKDPWDYKDKYLITLCSSCHSIGHSRWDVPVKYL